MFNNGFLDTQRSLLPQNESGMLDSETPQLKLLLCVSFHTEKEQEAREMGKKQKAVSKRKVLGEKYFVMMR